MQSILTQQSLVKYDTPFLVSTTISNKKTLEELDENNENAEIFLRNMIKRGDEVIYNLNRLMINQNMEIYQ